MYSHLTNTFYMTLSRKVSPSLKGTGIGNCGPEFAFFFHTYYLCQFSHCHVNAVDSGPFREGVITHVTALCSHILEIRIK